MKSRSAFWRSLFQPAAGRRAANFRNLVPAFDGLEDRKVMATMNAVAFSSILNTQVNDIVYGNGELVEVRAPLVPILGILGGPTTTVLATSGVKSVGIAFDKLGHEVQTIVMTNGAAYQDGGYNTSTHSFINSQFQGYGVEDETVTFDPTGHEVNSVVYSNGDLYQIDSGGSHFLGTNVLSASLAYDLLGNAVEDVVFTNHNLYEYDGVNGSSHLLATNAVSVDQAIGLLFGEVQEVVYTNGQSWQYGNNPVLGSLTLGILGGSSAQDDGAIF